MSLVVGERDHSHLILFCTDEGGRSTSAMTLIRSSIERTERGRGEYHKRIEQLKREMLSPALAGYLGANEEGKGGEGGEEGGEEGGGSQEGDSTITIDKIFLQKIERQMIELRNSDESRQRENEVIFLFFFFNLSF